MKKNLNFLLMAIFFRFIYYYRKHSANFYVKLMFFTSVGTRSNSVRPFLVFKRFILMFFGISDFKFELSI
jgi:hypothetical protein